MTLQVEILNKIKEYNTIIIHRHVIPDGDCYGSQVGLAEIIRTNFPEKQVYIVGEELDYLKYIDRMNTISDEVYKGALVIVVDTSNSPRISDNRWTKGDFIIKIDHHPLSDVYANIEWVDTSYPACCEMITDFMIQNELSISDHGARALFNGIVSDTGRFMYRGVSERTFKYAGHLINYAFDLTEVYANMYIQSKELARFKGYAVLNFEETENGVGYLKLTDKILKELGVSEVSASANVNTLANIEGIHIWALFVENAETGDIRINLRSTGAPVNQVAIKYGGGGHVQAAGAKVADWTTIDAVIEDLDNLLKNA